MANKLALPPKLAGVHDMFYLSVLWKYAFDLSHIVNQETIKISEDLSYEEISIAILDRKVHTKIP